MTSLLREAVAGSEQDFTTGPVWRAVVLLSIPMVLELSMESLFAICDVFLVGIAGLFVAFARHFIGLFTDDATVIAYGADALRFISYGYLFFAYGMVIVQAFNGAGDTVTPTTINFFCYWLFQIPLAWFLATETGLEARGVFLAITVAESMITVVGVAVFRRGRWKERKI